MLLQLPQPLMLMVSGGIDSSVLLHLAVEAGCDVSVVHCNHGIRAESNADEAFVRGTCARYGVPFTAVTADVPALAKQKGIGIETAAREFRQSVMADRIKLGYTVCTAHHADDNAETVLMHLLRGCGVRGLVAMRSFANGVARPLLGYTRAEIESYAAAFQVRHIEDVTNIDTSYTRNFVRHRVMPVLNERFAATEALNRLAEHAAAVDAFIAGSCDFSQVRQTGETVRFPLSNVADVRGENYLRHALGLLGVYDNVGTAAVDAVRRLQGKQSGRRVDLPDGIIAVKEHDDVVLYRETEPPAPQPFREGDFPSFGVRFAPCAVSPKKGTLRFDPDKLPEGCVLRTREVGDVFRPYGGPHKILKKYMTDKKIPARMKDKLPLVAKGHTVYVVCGIEISESVKLDENSTRAVQIYSDEGYYR